MKIISSKRFILLILATSSLLTSNVFCTDELMMSNLHSKENYDKYSEHEGDPKGEKERSLNFEELNDWGPRTVIKMSAPTVNKMPHSAANLPLRFGRTMEEKRSTGAMANLPLRFGRNIKESILRHIPNLPQRFGRTTAKSVAKMLSDLLQQSMHSPSANELLYSMNCQPQEIQNPDQKHPWRLGLKEIDDAELKQEK
ncbi:pro-FMRFamide-related neuropeptide VF precursor [Canis lupus familiaris]|uniref:Pro-FMRFamide-related neuropeptide VF n=2 Tax=Canis lupus TaxID=9612 RepID=E2QYB7_CANLF|nr:pro-FMRFamide-related neuropeptide VF precursor [Canis lupus familiaris]XP_025320587.1 pro-FMRFamide-related neuropeptide VF [Canis lupus dingo]AHZ31619.1 neuropeptide VF precursor [Canis lupus familiaris]|eukprot:NP_001279989.1 pro-FMRFamide-related neuropeptide VF precursor [Canis lupus familiaris]